VAYTASVRNSREAALKAARSKQRRTLERIQANLRDISTFLDALERVDDVEAWYREKIRELQAQADARRAKHRAKAGVAAAAIRARGESFAQIALMTGTEEKIIRDLIRNIPEPGRCGATPAQELKSKTSP